MKKVIYINLAGQQLAINEDAYEALESYIHSIERRFSSSEGKSDILYDIEYRLMELFMEDRVDGDIISLEKIERVKAIMGMPKEFGEEYYAADTPKQTSTERRLFRDPDDKILAGVASGLSAYFGMDKPLLIRIVFVVLAMTSIGIFAYFLFWIFVPKAQSASDKLAMKGQPINIETIGDVVSEGLTDIKESIEDLSKNIKSKMS